MDDDIVTLLRKYQPYNKLHGQAADEIERLRELLNRAYRLAVGNSPDFSVFADWEDAISAYEEARRG